MKIKSILFMSLGLMFAGGLKAQLVQLGGSICFDMPAGAKKMNAADKASFAKKQEIAIVGMPQDSSKSFYVLKDVIVSLSVGRQKEKVNLEDMKKWQDETGREIPGHRAEFLSLNGNSFLTSQNPLSGKIWFYGTDPTGMEMLFGVLEFNEQNRGKANAALADVLKGISYRPSNVK